MPNVRDHLPFKQGLRPCLICLFLIFKQLVRDHLPFKQGLRQLVNVICNSIATVRDHLPFKQGLRHITFLPWSWHIASQRPSSIQTRIKTICSGTPLKGITPCQRPSSIQTRIKTIKICTNKTQLRRQRPSSIQTRIKTTQESCFLVLEVLSQRLSSIQTRIKTHNRMFFQYAAHSVRDYLPFKQGLRHTEFC